MGKGQEDSRNRLQGWLKTRHPGIRVQAVKIGDCYEIALDPLRVKPVLIAFDSEESAETFIKENYL